MLWKIALIILIVLIVFLSFAFFLLFMKGADMRNRNEYAREIDDNEQEKSLAQKYNKKRKKTDVE